MKRELIFLIFAAIILRLILASTTFHPDLLAFHFANFAFADQFILNIYDYLHNPPLNSPIRLYGTDFFTWPPLAYFLLGFLTLLTKPLFNIEFARLLSPENLFASSEIFRHLLLLKLPYLLFDLLAAFFLVKLFKDDKQKKWALYLWLFNPVLLYATYMIGQFDVIPTFFVVLSLFLAQQSKSKLALLSLGFGGALKMFPLLLVPFASVILGKKVSEKISLLALGFAPFVISILPFLSSEAFRSVSLFSAQSQKLLFAGVNVSGADILYLFLIFFILLFFYSLKYGELQNLWKFFFCVLLLFFALTNFHPQWFLWITPFLIIFFIREREIWIYSLILLLTYVGIVLLFEPSLSIGLFSPIFPELSNTPGISTIVAKYFAPTQLSSILRSIFAASAIWIIISLFKTKKTIL